MSLNSEDIADDFEASGSWRLNWNTGIQNILVFWNIKHFGFLVRREYFGVSARIQSALVRPITIQKTSLHPCSSQIEALQYIWKEFLCLRAYSEVRGWHTCKFSKKGMILICYFLLSIVFFLNNTLDKTIEDCIK